MARKALDKASKSCENSNDWHDKWRYYNLYGNLAFCYRKDAKAAVDYFHKAYQSFPFNEPVNQEFLAFASDLTVACDSTKQYQLGENIASDALFRSSCIVDSCIYSAGLFTQLAKFYELRGDTIMPRHFHRKSQDLSIRYWIVSTKSDSIDIYNKRLDNLYQNIEGSRNIFGPKNTDYIAILNLLLYYVCSSGNVKESIYLGNEILKLVAEHNLENSDKHYETYYILLSNYAADGNISAVERLLPKAINYYSHFPNLYVDKDYLYYLIGEGLTFCKRFNDALSYLKLAKNELKKDNREPLKKLIDKKIKECEEHI